MKLSYLFLILFLSFISCTEIKTENPKTAFEYWSGEKPEENLNIIFAEYWRSAHWSYEYTFCMKFKPTEKWWNEFIKSNNLIKDMETTSRFENAPKFFNPSKSSIQFRPKEKLNDSRYYRDIVTGICYIYEIQL